MDEDELRATRILNGLIADDKVYTEKEVKENYVSKKKIEEKIKSLKYYLIREEGDNELCHALGTAIMHLEELLESEEKI